MKFTSDTSGFIRGIRFYKASTNTGTHTADLWSSTGQLLGTTTFSGESAAGWQQATFANPIAITAHYSDLTTEAVAVYCRGMIRVRSIGSSSTLPKIRAVTRQRARRMSMNRLKVTIWARLGCLLTL